MDTLSISTLRKVCPVKWHEAIPEDGISLGVADVDFAGPEGIIQHIKDRLIEDFSFYQDQRGLPTAVKSAVRYLNEKDIPAKKINIQIIEGTMMGIYIAMKWISKLPGDLLVLGPIYEPIHRHATSTGNTIHWTPITEDGLDYSDIKKQLAEKDIKMIVMCNPTNPIGYVFSEHDLQFLRDLIIEFDLYVFSDELYEPLWFQRKHRSIASYDGIFKRSILLYGFSKAYGLAGYRSGFMSIGPNPEVIREIASQIMVSPSPVSSLVTEFALEDERARNWVKEFRNQVRDMTEFAAKKFQKAGYQCHIPMGCFFVFPNIEVDDITFSEYLLQHVGIQVVPGSNFGPTGKNHLRINCATSKERLDMAISKIITSLSSFKQKESEF